MTNHTFLAHYVAAKIKPKPSEKKANTSVLWVLAAIIAVFMISCTKEVKTIQLRPPVRPTPVTVTLKFFPTSHPNINGATYGVTITTDRVMNVTTNFFIEWKDFWNYSLMPIIQKGYNTNGTHHTMLKIYGKPTDVRLVKVEGDTTLLYTLKVVE